MTTFDAPTKQPFKNIVGKGENVANSIFSFSLIFYPMTDKLKPFPNKLWFFIFLHDNSFENTVGKREIAHNKQFLLFVFYPFGERCHFRQICNFCLQSFLFGRV